MASAEPSYNGFPSDSIDPRLKDYDWILRFARACWGEAKSYIPNTMFYYGRSRIQEILEYCQGKQSINKYKKILLGDDVTDKTWLNIDWTPPAFMSKFIDIAIAKVLQNQYEIECFAVDPLAKSEEDEYYNQMKVKAMMREAMQKMGATDMLDSPALQAQPDEPQDLEQLQMQMKYGYKHQMAMESELGISLVMNQNNIEEVRKRMVGYQVKVGFGGYKDWVDGNGNVCFREVRPENMLTSYCLKPDFSDSNFYGEVIFLSVADLSPYFDPEQLEYICKNVAGQYGNPNYQVNGTSRMWDQFKVAVLDLQFKSWNSSIYKKEFDGRGNFRMNKTDYSNISRVNSNNSEDTIEFFKGAAEPKYMEVQREVWYKCKWLVGTDMMYDYGLKENTKRKASNWWVASSDFHLYAWNFQNMTYAGLGERLMPFEDKAALLWYKLQNLANKLIPYLINIDLNVLESTSFGKGGETWKPEAVVDFIFQNFVVPYRSTDLLASNPNYKPMNIEASGQLVAFAQLREELLGTIDMMRQVTGLNEVTDGSTPNAKNLNSTNAVAIDSTNNALDAIKLADEYLMRSLADAIVQDIQIAVKLGKVKGFAKALGTDSVKFYEISPDVANYELGIFTRPAPTQEQRQQLLAELNLKDSQGLIDPSDKILVMSCHNLKQAAELLAYKVEKRKEQQHQQQMELVQQQTEGNMQVAQTTEQMKQQTMAMQAEFDMQKIVTEKMWEYEIVKLQKTLDLQGEAIQVEGRTTGHAIQADSKIIASQIAGQASILKQEIANKKPQKKSA